MKNKEYYELIAEEIVSDLVSNVRIKNFTKNSDLLGAFAEECVKDLVNNVVSPLRVSTGSVVSKALVMGESDLPQLDLMIWNPTPFPAFFQKGSFGIVPTQSCVGILEVKRSNYSGVGKKIKKILDTAHNYVDGAPPKCVNRPSGKTEYVQDERPKALGIICLFDKTSSDNVLHELIEKKEVVSLLEHSGDMDLEPSLSGVLCLIDFLSVVRRRAGLSDGWKSINSDFIADS